MNPHPPATPPTESSDPGPDRASSRLAREALRSMPARDVTPPSESNRPMVVIGVIFVLGVIALNFAIYRASHRNQTPERWDQLTAYTNERRNEARANLGRLEQEARYVANRIVSGHAAPSVARPSRAHFALESDLDAAASSLGFHALAVVDEHGAVAAASTRGGQLDPARLAELSRQAAATGRVAKSIAPRRGEIEALAWIAVPLPRAGDRVRTLVGTASLNELTSRAFFTRDARAGAFLVRREAEGVLLLTEPPPGSGLRSGDRLARGLPRIRPSATAAMTAAAGRDSAFEIADPEGGALWVVVRAMPEIDAALVGQADRAVMLAGTRETLAGLLALDLGIVVLGVPSLWLWRRRERERRNRVAAQIAERESARFRAVFDHAFDSIVSFDPAGRVRAVNRAAEQLFGRPAAEIMGGPIQGVLCRSTSGGPGELDLAALKNVTGSVALRPDGSTVPVEYSLAAIGEGRSRFFAAIVRDVSERLEAEERIRLFAQGLEVTNRRLEEANAQLEMASRLKSEFLANTSHELRTPLNGMIGFLQLVLDGMCDTPEEERDFLQQALQCSRRLLGLINDVLDIAKIEAGKLSLEIEAVDVRSVFGEVYTLVHVPAAQQGLALTFETPDHPLQPVRGDFNKIKQVLLNLVGNSIKFTPQGSITVRATERVELGHTLFEVIDTGIGIPPERRSLLFEKFIQGDGSSTRKYGGTGLGLAIAKSLVELMGGIIDVDSEGPGKGTRMVFSLPLWREPSEEASDRQPRIIERIEGPAGGALILVVEDDDVFRQYLSALLHHHGYRTVEAGSAEAGWMLARRLRPALVILDYALSSAEAASLRTGWDLAERMTTDPATRRIPLIFVTGFDLQVKERIRNAMFARRPEHLMKPIEAPVLMSKIEEMVDVSHGGPVRVLMADDDPSVVAYVRKVLPEERYHIEVANNGDECLHILRTQPHGFDLLLLDLMMPDVSGYDVLRDLSLSHKHRDLPVLVLTNFPEARTDEEKRLLERGVVVDVISKPAVHENPMVLSHIIDWHLNVAAELGRQPPVHGPIFPEGAREAA